MHKTRVLTVGALSAALCTCCLFIASQLPTLRLALIFIASLCTILLAFEGKTAASVVSYLAGGLLSLLICPQKFPAQVYLLLFGSYAIFKIWIDRRVFRRFALYACKCTVFCAQLALCIFLAHELSLLPAVFETWRKMPTCLLLLPCGVILFFILDTAYTRAFSLYQTKIRPHIFPKC